METSLHRELKRRYAGDAARTEVMVDNYRIDAVRGTTLVEIQHGSLVAIRDKIRRLLGSHRVLVVKPIVARKLLIKQSDPAGPIESRRLSPKRGQLLDIFDELVYFTRVFPHPRLTLEVVLVEIEEWRLPGHGRRRRWRATTTWWQIKGCSPLSPRCGCGDRPIWRRYCPPDCRGNFTPAIWRPDCKCAGMWPSGSPTACAR